MIVEKDTELVFDEHFIKIKGDDSEDYVMMDWEIPLMERYAELVAHNKGDILEIGFGMGILANFIQKQKVKSHTIVELNKYVYERAINWAKDKPNVNIIFGDWYKNADVINSKKYDGIHYDADCQNGHLFRKVIVDHCIKEDGLFSYFYPSLDYWYHEMKTIDYCGYGDNLKIEWVELNDIPEHVQYHDEYFCSLPYVKYPLLWKKS
jgi:hypothetical protein